MSQGFVPPKYPYDRLDSLRTIAASLDGGAIDLSIGTPCDPPPQFVVDALGSSGTERGYPASVGSDAYRRACSGWMARRLGVEVPTSVIAACIGTKELVASLPHHMSLRDPSRDTVLIPTLAYPTYEMGALLAGLRPVKVPMDAWGRMDLSAVSGQDAERSLLLWVNSPGNPAGQLEDLGSVVKWGRSKGVVVASDECYIEFTWQSDPRTVLEYGLDGVLAVHSLSKRSNLAGARIGFYAGDPELVTYLALVRSHSGMMVPGPIQNAGTAAYSDDAHVDCQREVYHRRLVTLSELLAAFGSKCELPEGGFYLWAEVPDLASTDIPPSQAAWDFAERLARTAGVIVSPGEFYGIEGSGFVRVAAVQPDERIEVALSRIK